MTGRYVVATITAWKCCMHNSRHRLRQSSASAATGCGACPVFAAPGDARAAWGQSASPAIACTASAPAARASMPATCADATADAMPLNSKVMQSTTWRQMDFKRKTASRRGGASNFKPTCARHGPQGAAHSSGAPARIGSSDIERGAQHAEPRSTAGRRWSCPGLALAHMGRRGLARNSVIARRCSRPVPARERLDAIAGGQATATFPQGRTDRGGNSCPARARASAPQCPRAAPRRRLSPRGAHGNRCGPQPWRRTARYRPVPSG